MSREVSWKHIEVILLLMRLLSISLFLLSLSHPNTHKTLLNHFTSSVKIEWRIDQLFLTLKNFFCIVLNFAIIFWQKIQQKSPKPLYSVFYYLCYVWITEKSVKPLGINLLFWHPLNIFFLYSKGNCLMHIQSSLLTSLFSRSSLIPEYMYTHKQNIPLPNNWLSKESFSFNYKNFSLFLNKCFRI